MPRETYTQSFGATLQLVTFVALLALVPYTLLAAYWLYAAVSSPASGSINLLVYPIARVIACVILTYALWKLRKTGLRLRSAGPPHG